MPSLKANAKVMDRAGGNTGRGGFKGKSLELSIPEEESGKR